MFYSPRVGKSGAIEIMKNAEEKAIEFLMGQVTLSKVSGDTSKLNCRAYNQTLENCDLYMFSLYHSLSIDEGRYVAVPRDGRAPFYIGG
jgi:hypothetical protein